MVAPKSPLSMGLLSPEGGFIQRLYTWVSTLTPQGD